MSVLFVLSSHDELGDTGNKTGTWLQELLDPYYLLVEKGVETRFATPEGGAAPIDPASVAALADDPLLDRYESDDTLKAKLASTEKLADLDADDFDAVYYPGGHGPLFDLRYDEASRKLIADTLAADKPVGVVCHAGCVLIDVKDADGKHIVDGRTITAFTDAEEEAVALTDAVPYSVEAELRALNTNYIPADLWAANVQVDGKLVTGQNPASAGPVAEKLLAVLGK